MSTENRASSMVTAKESATSASGADGEVPVVAPDPAQIFNRDVSALEMKDQILHIIDQNRCNFIMNGNLDKKVEDNL